MHPKDFRAFVALCKQQGMNEVQMAALLGASKNSITRWKHHPAPDYIGLAIAAIQKGLKPWKAPAA